MNICRKTTAFLTSTSAQYRIQTTTANHFNWLRRDDDNDDDIPYVVGVDSICVVCLALATDYLCTGWQKQR